MVNYKKVIEISLTTPEVTFKTIGDLYSSYLIQSFTENEQDKELLRGFEQFCKDNNLTMDMSLTGALEKLQ